VTCPLRLAPASLAALLWVATAASAHTTSTGLATVTVAGASVTYRLTLVLAELPEDPARLLAAAAEGDPTSAERVADLLRGKIAVRTGAAACRPGRIVIQGSRLGDSRAVLELGLTCPSAPDRLALRDDLFDLLGEHHRSIVRVEGPTGAREVALLPKAREATVDLGAGAPAAPASFIHLGVEHILTGYDHLLFLLALLARGGGLWSLFKIVTAFTVAHSVTLALAVLGLVSIPARVVEPAIAASIVWVALENVLVRDAPSQRWLVSFCFGLIHGLGFASALGPLALPAWNLTLALLGFNLGVEAGQALVVMAVLPLLLWAQRHPWEPRVAQATSLVLAGLGLIWVLQRLFFA
jgi:hydrogenase/urease accessory protein HupE